MRDPIRIPAIMSKLQAVWEKYPDMRLGQMIMAVVQAKDPKTDLFNLEDSRLEEMIKEFGHREDSKQTGH